MLRLALKIDLNKTTLLMSILQDAVTNRTLTLISKTIQSLGNIVSTKTVSTLKCF